jgi:hypothetical protein
MGTIPSWWAGIRPFLFSGASVGRRTGSDAGLLIRCHAPQGKQYLQVAMDSLDRAVAEDVKAESRSVGPIGANRLRIEVPQTSGW